MVGPVIQQEITHDDIAAFANDRVNLKKERLDKVREQARTLKLRLEKHIADHPHFELRKTMESGSIAKGTALSTLNDFDLAVYVQAESAPKNESDLLNWLAERLSGAYPNMTRDQFKPEGHRVKISFKGTGLDVDVVPVIYEGADNDVGYLITSSGDRVLTSIPVHLAFIRKRKEQVPDDFAQLIRLTKWWAAGIKLEDESFRFKSFLSELLWAHLLRVGVPVANYPDALQQFFLYIVKTGLKERIAFNDYYDPAKITPQAGVIQVYDPVNPKNNIASRYTEIERQKIVERAQDALDAINEAQFATTKGRAVEMWKMVLGPSFRG